MKQAEVDAVISAIYEAPLDLESWRSSLEAVAKLAGAAGGGHFFMFDPTQERVMLSHTPTWMSREGEATYNQHYMAADPRRLLVGAAQPGHWVYDHDHFDSRYVGRSDVYQFLIKHGIRYLAGTNLIADSDLLATFAIFRSPDQRQFGHSEKELLKRLSPHLVRAAKLTLQLEEVRERLQLSLTALDSLPEAVVVTDKLMRVVLQNRRAEALFRDAKWLKASGDKILARTVDDQRRLQSAVSQAIEAGAGAFLHISASDAGPLFCRVLPAPEASTVAELKPRRLALLICKSTAVSAAQVSAIAAMYGLTPAETRVAELLVSGARQQEISVALGTSLNTVKTHLKQVFDKTGTHRQSELWGLFRAAAF